MPSYADEVNDQVFSEQDARCESERKPKTSKLSEIQIPMFFQPEPISIKDKKNGE